MNSAPIANIDCHLTTGVFVGKLFVFRFCNPMCLFRGTVTQLCLELRNLSCLIKFIVIVLAYEEFSCYYFWVAVFMDVIIAHNQ